MAIPNIGANCCHHCTIFRIDGRTGNFYSLCSFIFAFKTKHHIMTTYHVQINVLPLKDLLDPQGKAVLGGLHNLGLNGISDVRIGKHITLQIEVESELSAKTKAEEACKTLLANPVMEFYEIEMVQGSLSICNGGSTTINKPAKG
jgi:phosphoribosylformylglycinamidine synthase